MIWLVGSKGQLGAEVEQLLQARRHVHTATDREIDITDRGAASRFADSLTKEPLTWIINCAAYTAVDKAEEEPDLAFAVNETGVVNLCRAAKAAHAALLHISTDYVFDGTKEGDYREEDTPNPIGVYARSKHRGELAVQDSLDRYVIVRTAWLYGRQGRSFVSTMTDRFRKPGKVCIVNDHWGNPTYAKDLACAILAIIEHPGPPNGVYHFANEGRTCWFEFAAEIYSQAVARGAAIPEVELIPIPAAEYPAKAYRPRNSALSKEKIKRTFDVVTRSWQDALRSFFEEGEGKVSS
jgi:dTDP-4-dehydrorhamnose reductase